MNKIFLLPLLLCFSFRIYSQTLNSTNLPIILIDTKGQTISDEPKIKANMKIISYGPGLMNHPEDPANVYNGDIGIEVRGKYSASLPQKPYGFETWDTLGQNMNVSLLGMPKENDWILLANYNDKSFVRNSLAFKIFRDMGHWAPRTKLCEVIINQAYQGIYVLTEKIKVDKNRINIDKLDISQNSGDDLTGGYVFSIDYYSNWDSWTGSYAPIGYADKQVNFVYNFPKPDEITATQKSYIRDYIYEFETKLYGQDFKNVQTGYRAYIDVQSFIDYFIVNELARNVDGYKKSCFYNKSRDSKGGKLSAGPVWDFDWAWKNIWDCSIFQVTDGSGWAYKILDCNPWPTPTGWIPRLMQDPSFVSELKNRYTTLRGSILSTPVLMSYIDSVNNYINEAQARHYTRWPILGQSVGAPEVEAIPATFEGETTKFKNWITTRLAWLDQQMLVTSVPEIPDQSNFKLYPNPAHELLILEANEKIQSFAICSIIGKEIMVKADLNTNKIQIDINGLSPGLYTAKLYMKNGDSASKFFVIQ